jgi:hypothetical protein
VRKHLKPYPRIDFGESLERERSVVMRGESPHYTLKSPHYRKCKALYNEVLGKIVYTINIRYYNKNGFYRYIHFLK